MRHHDQSARGVDDTRNHGVHANVTEDASFRRRPPGFVPSKHEMNLLPYTERGTGEPVLLFLHFFGSSQREWRHVTEQLQSDFRCVTADMPGFGDANKISGYTVEQMAEHLRDLLAHLAPAPVILVAHSFSGKPAMVIAATPPDNLRKVILVAPTTLVPEPITPDAREAMRGRDLTHEGAVAFVEGSHYRPLSDEDMALAVADVLRADRTAWLAWPDSGSLEDWSSRVTELRIPTYLICGEHDKAIPVSFQREHTVPLVEASGGRLIVIAGAAHMLPNEAPAELVAAIRECAA